MPVAAKSVILMSSHSLLIACLVPIAALALLLDGIRTTRNGVDPRKPESGVELGRTTEKDLREGRCPLHPFPPCLSTKVLLSSR